MKMNYGQPSSIKLHRIIMLKVIYSNRREPAIKRAINIGKKRTELIKNSTSLSEGFVRSYIQIIDTTGSTGND